MNTEPSNQPADLPGESSAPITTFTRCHAEDPYGFTCQRPAGHEGRHRAGMGAWTNSTSTCPSTFNENRCSREEGHTGLHMRGWTSWADHSAIATYRCNSRCEGRRCEKPIEHQGDHTSGNLDWETWAASNPNRTIPPATDTE